MYGSVAAYYVVNLWPETADLQSDFLSPSQLNGEFMGRWLLIMLLIDGPRLQTFNLIVLDRRS